MTQPNGGYNHDPLLRARIQAFSPDEPGVVFPFSAKLARENGWTRPFAERVMEEYRRFLYLAMTAGHPVSPSVAVDQAWHQHLTYTRSYWDELCGRVLGRPLHHNPTKGGGAEKQKHVDGYARTLDSYRAAFGEEPPRDVWPAPAERFAPAARIRQVSEATHWIIRKPRLPRRIGRTTAAAGVLLLAGACAAADSAGSAVILTVQVILVLALIWAMVNQVIRIWDGITMDHARWDAKYEKWKREPRYRRDRARDWARGTSAAGGGTYFAALHDSGGGDCGDGGSGCSSGCGGGCGGCG